MSIQGFGVGVPPMYRDPKEMQAKVNEYFDILESKEKHATITGLCLHLGFCSRQSFYDYEKKPEFSYTIKTARMMVEAQYEASLMGRYTAGAIFALKNLGWSDKQELEHSGEVKGAPQIGFANTTKKENEA